MQMVSKASSTARKWARRFVRWGRIGSPRLNRMCAASFTRECGLANSAKRLEFTRSVSTRSPC
jgi:hypothetical protein